MNKKRRSQKQEKSVAKEMNAKTVIASGAFWGMKADVRGEDFLIECKTTKKDYYNITTVIWEKIALEAVRDRVRIPLLFVDLRDSERYVIFSPKDFENKFFEYQFVNLESECRSQYKFTGYSNLDVPIVFFLKSNNFNWVNSHCLMAMKYEEFDRVYGECLK